MVRRIQRHSLLPIRPPSPSRRARRLNAVIFNPGASAFSITSTPLHILTISGAGVTNNSGIIQKFVVDQDDSGERHGITFTDSATAGNATLFTMIGGVGSVGTGGVAEFFDNSSADHGVFEIFGASSGGFTSGSMQFYDSSTAGNGTFSVHRLAPIYFYGTTTAGDAIINNSGTLYFYSEASGGNSTITNNGGLTYFKETTNAGHVTLTNNCDRVTDAPCGDTEFSGDATADSGVFTNNGATVNGASGGLLQFVFGSPTAANATLIANGGSNGGGGGLIKFWSASDGGKARVEVFGNGSLDISSHNAPGVTIGSLEGDGLISLGPHNLTTGRNNLTTIFSGVIQDSGAGGSLTKTGGGNLSLTNANTYSGETTLNRGTLFVRNTSSSATGTGAVQVNAGALSGAGTIAGAVIIGKGSGRGAFVSPGSKFSLGTLTVQSMLTFNADATYDFALNSNQVAADKIVANGVTINSSAFLSFVDNGNVALPVGTVFTVISNTAATLIAGTFSNLADGTIVTIGNNTFQADYEGGDWE